MGEDDEIARVAGGHISSTTSKASTTDERPKTIQKPIDPKKAKKLKAFAWHDRRMLDQNNEVNSTC